MPELPDLETYRSALQRRLIGHTLLRVRLNSPFLLRTVEPPLEDAHHRTVVDVLRLGKRLVLGLEGELFLVLHLMIAGRLHWKPPSTRAVGPADLASFDFSHGSLTLTERGPKKRASLAVANGREALKAHDPGGLEVLSARFEQFLHALQKERHTLKRALTNPYQFAGIGNAYSDEILHRARLSPLQLSKNLSDEEARALFDATRATLSDWTARLKAEAGDAFPDKVTAFRPEMAVHGRFGKPCPVCQTAVERVVSAENEFNYCPRCQTKGRRLADRLLSRLLGADWPRRIDE